MSAISTRYPTSSRSSTYLPTTTIDSCRKTTYSTYNSSAKSSLRGDPTYRRSYILDRYDTPTASSRFGVSRLTSAIQSTSIPSSRAITSSTCSRKSFDRDYSSKPPIGSRFRSDSRLRELSLERTGYISSIDTKKPDSTTTTTSTTSSSQTLNTTKRSSTTSLARSLATCGADLYEKYSVANYKPNCELSRSRSLTDSKLDSLNTSHTTVRRSTSKDRSTPSALGGSLLASSSCSAAATKDYLTPSINAIAQVKATNTNELLSVCAINLANSRCFRSINSSSPTHLTTNSIDNTNKTNNSNNNNYNNNYNYNNNNNHNTITTTITNTTIPILSTTATTTTTATNNTKLHQNDSNNRKHSTIINDSSNNNNRHLNALSDAICVSTASNTNPTSLNSTRNIKSIHNSSIVIDTKCDAIKTLNTTTAATVAAQLRGAAPIASARDKLTTPTKPTASATIKVQANAPNATHTIMNGCKTSYKEHSLTKTNNNNSNSTIQNNINNNKNGSEAKLMSPNESFRRRLGTNRLSPYNDPNFLKCEYDLARSQVINSRSKSASADDCKLHTNNNPTNKNGFVTNLANTLTTSTKDLNRNKITANDANLIKASAINGFKKTSDSYNTQQQQSIDSNSNEKMNVNCVQQRAIDQLDEIKFIDSDDSERKQSIDTINVATLKDYFDDVPAITKLSKNMKNSAMPSTVRHRNENGLANGCSAHSVHFENGVSRKAVHDEMLSATSSNASAISAAISDRSASPMPMRSIVKDFSAIKLDNFDASSENVSICCYAFHN